MRRILAVLGSGGASRRRMWAAVSTGGASRRRMVGAVAISGAVSLSDVLCAWALRSSAGGAALCGRSNVAAAVRMFIMLLRH
jgi:hypothetical protein